GDWEIWKGILPPNEGLPGDPRKGEPGWSVVDYMTQSIALLRALFQAIQDPADATKDRQADTTSTASDGRSPNVVIEGIARLMRYGELAALAGLIEAIALLEVVFGSLSQYPENLILRFLDAITNNARSVLEGRLAHDAGTRRVWQVIDLTLATLRGEI